MVGEKREVAMKRFCIYSTSEDGMCDSPNALECAKRKCKGEEDG